MIQHADDQTFDRIVHGHPGTVLVEFYTPSCQPCRALEPILQAVAKRLQGRALVVKVNSEYAIRTAREYGVRMAPTLIVFQNGKPMQAIQGNPNDEQRIVDFVKPYM